MLEKLTVKNFILLKDIEIEFSKGLNIITGETGAGKSILLNALELLSGGRADYSVISSNDNKMIIEGTFKCSSPAISDFIKSREIESFNDFIIARRELSSKGFSRCYINDSPVSNSDLRELGDLLFDIHSQNEHQSLLRKEVHLQLLDKFSAKFMELKFNETLSSYRKLYADLKLKQEELNKMKELRDRFNSNRDYVLFRLNEINKVNPQKGEDELIEKELIAAENIETIRNSLDLALKLLYEDKGCVMENIEKAKKELSRISSYLNETEKLTEDLNNASVIIKELSREIIGLLERTGDTENINADELRERLSELQFVKKKYGGTIDEVLKLKDKLINEISESENYSAKILEIEKKIEEISDEMCKLSAKLTAIRRSKAKELEVKIKAKLGELGFEKAEFKIEINTDKEKTKTAPGISGSDEVEFLVKLNTEGDFVPLRKTASGGEISRIMLAIKSVFADLDAVDVLIFDEIDSGISGRIARKAGLVMKELSAKKQVIAVTHLAQISSLADTHILVEKKDSQTRIRKLSKEESLYETARLLSGENITEAALKGARELAGE